MCLCKIRYLFISAQHRIPPISYPSLKLYAVAFRSLYQSQFWQVIPSKSRLNSSGEIAVFPKQSAPSQQVNHHHPTLLGYFIASRSIIIWLIPHLHISYTYVKHVLCYKTKHILFGKLGLGLFIINFN